jgi:hypothetical protein
MSARLSDEQLAQALQACVPMQTPLGSADRLFETIAKTPQDRPLPIVLAQLRDADPVSRRRSLLIAAALLLAMAIASAAAVGAWRLVQRDPIDELSLEPPGDVPAFVLSSYERLPQLPPVALTWHDSESRKGRVYVDRSGTVRFDRFASAEATEPSSSTIVGADHRISGIAPVASEAVWVEPGHEAIGDDPRVFIRTVLGVPDLPPGCEMERGSGEVGGGAAAAGWRYIGLEPVAGRPTHHVTCGGVDLWLDIESRLILRTEGPAVDDAGQPIRAESTEVTDIEFGEQPAALFEPPVGVTRLSEDAYLAYLCTAGELPNEQVVGLGPREGCPTEAEATSPPEPSPSPTPSPTERPNTSPCAVQPGNVTERDGPLGWTQASMKKDWPAPVRPEPAGGGSVQPMRLTYLDPMRDNGSEAYPCVDIRWVTANTSEVHVKVDSTQPVVDPADAWIAYGIVTDVDRDGVPDWRYGIDNMPADAADHGPPTRGWRTNLHTDQTDAGPEHDEMVWSAYGEGTPMGRAPKSVYPRRGSDVGFLFGGAFETTQGSSRWGSELDVPFYTWASVIVDGRVVATDYAPDTGWLVATGGSRPGGTYRIGDPFPELSMTVPEGWTTSSTSMSSRFGNAGELRRVACGGLPRGFPGDVAYEADCARVRFQMIDKPPEPCRDEIQPRPETSVDDLVNYVLRVPGIREVADVTVDGHRGKQLAYSPGEEGASDCLLSGYEDIWVLDVDGVPLMIGSSPGGSLELDISRKALKAEIRQMVASIHFER